TSVKRTGQPVSSLRAGAGVFGVAKRRSAANAAAKTTAVFTSSSRGHIPDRARIEDWHSPARAPRRARISVTLPPAGPARRERAPRPAALPGRQDGARTARAPAPARRG